EHLPGIFGLLEHLLVIPAILGLLLLVVCFLLTWTLSLSRLPYVPSVPTFLAILVVWAGIACTLCLPLRHRAIVTISKEVVTITDESPWGRKKTQQFSIADLGDFAVVHC